MYYDSNDSHVGRCGCGKTVFFLWDTDHGEPHWVTFECWVTGAAPRGAWIKHHCCFCR
jgi:hypothetical protein